MAIETYDFPKLTQVIKDVFPVKSCSNPLFCNFNFNMLSKYINLSTGLFMGNEFAIKQAQTLGRGDGMGGSGGISFDDEDDFSSPSKYLYYNTDIKYPVY
jgi:hypothetical protein